MATRKYQPFRILRVKKSDDLKTIYAKAKKAFTAEDLMQFIEPDDRPSVSGEELMARLEAAYREGLRKRRKKKG